MLQRLFLISKNAITLSFYKATYKHNEDFEKLFAIKIRETFEKLGPTFIKLGQILSMRPDFIPESYCHEFEKCLDQGLQLPFSAIQQTIEKELKKPIEKLFSLVKKNRLPRLL